MDLPQQRSLNFMLRHTYTQIFNRTLSYYLAVVIYEIKESIKLDKKWLEHELSKYDISQHASVMIQLKDKATVALLNEGKIKHHLLQVLDDKVKMRADIIEEVMKQNGLDKDTEAEWIRDKMIPVFDNCVKKLRFKIEKRDMFNIYEDIRNLYMGSAVKA